MIQTEQQIEQPGKNAIDHPCQMKVEIPGDDGEPSSFRKCTILALVQCSECTAWICGNEELDHSNICIRCSNAFCPDCYQPHHLSRDCEQISQRESERRSKLRGYGFKHGLAGKGKATKEYRCWQNIINRCHRPCHGSYKNYGARGIVVCDRWRASVKDFIADMGLSPSPKHSIERIDNDGNYEPGNCRWATKIEQCRNVRSNRLFEWNGKTMCAAEIAESVGLKYSTLHTRLERGWPIEEAVKPPKHSGYLKRPA